MKQYIDLLKKIKQEGREKESGRENMPNTIGISHSHIEHNLQDGFPLLTTKKMYWKGIVHELLWFLRGETNIKYLVDNNVNIWNDDAYRWYQKHCSDQGILRVATEEEFIYAIKNNIKWNSIKEPECPKNYTLGDLGKVYGHQWRNQNGVDQVAETFDSLKNNPYSRYQIIDGWNKKDFPEMALPPCHLLYQFIVRPLTIIERENLYIKKYGFELDDYPFPNFTNKEVEDKLDDDNIPKYFLDLNMYQRSCDTFLGVPFNIASMSLLNILFAKALNMVAGTINWIGGDTHLYVNHISKADLQISREPKKLPEININKEINNLYDILDLTIDDFELVGYESHPRIKAELFTGIKK